MNAFIIFIVQIIVQGSTDIVIFNSNIKHILDQNLIYNKICHNIKNK